MRAYDKKFRLWESAALIALCISLYTGAWAQSRQSSLSEGLVRLHVLAVSDAPEEQELKLRVRDAVLEYLSPALAEVDSPQEAKQLIGQSLEGIATAAESASEGRQVTVSLSRESYPTREYEGFTLPAGRYDSLRVVLGEGRGHNWWCIVFPPVCLSAAQAEQVESVMSQEDFALVTEGEGYQLRFRLLELWGELTAMLGG